MSRMSLLCALMVVSLLNPSSGFSSDLTPKQTEMIQTLNNVTKNFLNNYAPLEWKREQFGKPLEKAYLKAVEKIESDPDMSVKEYQRLLVEFTGSTRDYHVGITFNDTESATLPVGIRGFEPSSGDVGPTDKRRYFVVWVQPGKLAGTPLRVGDEVLEFDGKPIRDVINKLVDIKPVNSLATDHRIAEMFLSRRYGAIGYQVPKGAVTLKIKGKGESKDRLVALTWTYQKNVFPKPRKPEPESFLKKMSFQAESDGELPKRNTPQVMSALGHQMQLVRTFQASASEVENENSASEEQSKVQESESLHLMGNRKSFVPKLGTVVNPIGEGKVYDAYVYMTPDRRMIGYLRIPSWGYPGLSGEAELDQILQFFEQNVDGIVIDQFNNPGGSLHWTYGFASRFTQEAFAAPQTRHILEHDRAHSYYQWAQAKESDYFSDQAGIQNEHGLVFDKQAFQGLRSYYQFQYDEILEGKKLSSLYPYFGLSNINPHPSVRVTKPVLMLVNELSMSGGDFTPAIMQANGMAKIFGVRTRGAGGHISAAEVGFNFFGVRAMRLTHSLAYIPNSTDPIENNGVSPDIAYQLSVDDIEQGYTPIKDAINTAIIEMIDAEAKVEESLTPPTPDGTQSI